MMTSVITGDVNKCKMKINIYTETERGEKSIMLR